MSLGNLNKERAKISESVSILLSGYTTKYEHSRLFDESNGLLNFLRKHSEFHKYLSSPMYSGEQKEKFVLELIRLFAFNQTFSNALLLLLKHDLIGHLSFFLEALIFRLEKLLNQRIVKVYCSQKLTKVRQEKLQKILEERFKGESIVVEHILAPEMIAGIKVEYDDVVMECSIAKKLEEIKKELLKI